MHIYRRFLKIPLRFKACLNVNEVCYDVGEMAERSKAAVLKTVESLRTPGVRIPLSPPNNSVPI